MNSGCIVGSNKCLTGIVEDKPYIHVLPDSPDYDFLLASREDKHTRYLQKCGANDQVGYEASNINYWLAQTRDPDITARIDALRASGRADIGDALQRYRAHVQAFLVAL